MHWGINPWVWDVGNVTGRACRIIDAAFEKRDSVGPATTGAVREAVTTALGLLDRGEARVAERGPNGDWTVNQWLKKAVLLSFRLQDMRVITGGPGNAAWWDKVDSKFEGWNDARFRAAGFRAVPSCVVRHSAYIAPGVVLMPSFVNLGAYVDSGTMVDTWATVGSCAQIGKNCHISGGAGIGGVLEPLQAGPVIIEDNCFIGARSEVAEGVVVREGSVLSMGVLHRRLDHASSIGRAARYFRVKCRPIPWWCQVRCPTSPASPAPMARQPLTSTVR